MQFAAGSLFVWITLLTTRAEAAAALQIQGPGWNARKTGTEKIRMKSMACKSYRIRSKQACGAGLVQCRNTTFVHKSSLPRRIFKSLSVREHPITGKSAGL
jgi:hypothetical protein